MKVWASMTAQEMIADVREEMLNEERSPVLALLPYAGRTHSEILDALPLTDDEWDEIQASATPTNARPTVLPGAYFPGWHGITEMGW